MKPKLMFWIDMQFLYFGLAKSLQEMFDCELFTIIECTDKPKKFFKEGKGEEGSGEERTKRRRKKSGIHN